MFTYIMLGNPWFVLIVAGLIFLYFHIYWTAKFQNLNHRLDVIEKDFLQIFKNQALHKSLSPSNVLASKGELSPKEIVTMRTNLPASGLYKRKYFIKRHQLSYWLGALALSVGGFYLASHMIENRILGVWTSFFMAGVVGLAFLVTGIILHRHPRVAEYKIISQILTAAGIVILYGNIYSGYAVHKIFTANVLLVNVGILSILSVFLSMLMGQMMGVFVLICSFFAPFILKDSSVPLAHLILLIVLLNVLSLTHKIQKTSFVFFTLICLASMGGVFYLYDLQKHFIQNSKEIIPAIIFLLGTQCARMHIVGKTKANLLSERPPQFLNAFLFTTGFALVLSLTKKVTLSYVDGVLYVLLTMYSVFLAAYFQSALRWCPWLISFGVLTLLWKGEVEQPLIFLRIISLYCVGALAMALWWTQKIHDRAKSLLWMFIQWTGALYLGYKVLPFHQFQGNLNWPKLVLVSAVIGSLGAFFPHISREHFNKTMGGVITGVFLLIGLYFYMKIPSLIFPISALELFLLVIAGRIYGLPNFVLGIQLYMIILVFFGAHTLFVDAHTIKLSYFSRVLETLIVPMGYKPMITHPQWWPQKLSIVVVCLMMAVHGMRQWENRIRANMASLCALMIILLASVGSYAVYRMYYEENIIYALWASRSLVPWAVVIALIILETYSTGFHTLLRQYTRLLHVALGIWVLFIGSLFACWQTLKVVNGPLNFWLVMAIVGIGYIPIFLLGQKTFLSLRKATLPSTHAVFVQMAMLYWLTLSVFIAFSDYSSQGVWKSFAAQRAQYMTAAWMLVLGLSIFLGIQTRIPSYFKGARGLAYLLLIKVFLLDASHLTGLARVASFMVLGFGLIGVNYAFNRYLLPKPQNVP